MKEHQPKVTSPNEIVDLRHGAPSLLSRLKLAFCTVNFSKSKPEKMT